MSDLKMIAERCGDVLGVWAGAGGYGEAYHTESELRILKETTDLDEVLCAYRQLLFRHENPDTDYPITHLVRVERIYPVSETTFAIVMEQLSLEGVEDVFNELEAVSELSGYSLQELDLEDEDVRQWAGAVSDEAHMMLDDIQAGILDAQRCGFNANDIHVGNIGINSQGEYVLMDQRSGIPHDHLPEIERIQHELRIAEVEAFESLIDDICDVRNACRLDHEESINFALYLVKHLYCQTTLSDDLGLTFICPLSEEIDYSMFTDMPDIASPFAVFVRGFETEWDTQGPEALSRYTEALESGSYNVQRLLINEFDTFDDFVDYVKNNISLDNITALPIDVDMCDVHSYQRSEVCSVEAKM